MKRWMILLAVVAIALPLASCSKKNSGESGKYDPKVDPPPSLVKVPSDPGIAEPQGKYENTQPPVLPQANPTPPPTTTSSPTTEPTSEPTSNPGGLTPESQPTTKPASEPTSKPGTPEKPTTPPPAPSPTPTPVPVAVP